MTERDIFIAALQQPGPAERAAYLDGACGGDQALRGRVEELLREQEQLGSFLERPAADEEGTGPFTPASGEETPPALAEKPGMVIGPYKLLQQIGEGGMGAVFMAEQTQPVKRKVALKLIKPGMDSRQVIARFEAERQALAMMDHVNIARVFDAGTTDSGRPYFVMELVHGVPITKYCDDNHLTPRERLELFVPVCQAIQHAHQKGIIHRDIKPSNVMVTLYDGKPVPKVIDFGVAKATEQKLTEQTLFTRYGTMVGTLEYMSPEQAEMSALGVDTRSDVYSLGVLLYELLTGSTPLTRKRFKDAAYGEILRIIKEEEPPKPSTRLSESGKALASISAQRKTEPAKLSKLMRGELDWIVMKTLEKDRNRRYETANGFAADVQRYLNDEPVQACPPSAGYRLRKFVRRNKRALTTMTLLSVMLLGAVGTVAGSVGWAARDRTARRMVVQQAAARALEDAEDFQKQGKWQEALAAGERAEAALASGDGGAELQKQVNDQLADLRMIARLDDLRTQWGENFDHYTQDRAYARLFADFGIDVENLNPEEIAAQIRRRPSRVVGVAAGLDDWVRVLRDWGFAFPHQKHDPASWKRLLEAARLADPDPWRTQLRESMGQENSDALRQLADASDVAALPVQSLQLMGCALILSGDAPACVAWLRKAHQQHPGDCLISFDLAFHLKGLPSADHAEVLRFAEAALAARPQSASLTNCVGECLGRLGRYDEAIANFRRALDLKPDDAHAHNYLGAVLMRQGKQDEAVAECRKAIELDPKFGGAHMELGYVLKYQGKSDEAVVECRKAIDLDPKDALAHNNLGAILRDQGKQDEAVAEFRKAIDFHPKYALAHSNLGETLAWQGKLDEGVAECRKAIELDPKLPQAQQVLGIVLTMLGKHSEAMDAYREAIRLKPDDAMAHNGLAWLLATCPEPRLRDPVTAVSLAKKAIELDPKQDTFLNTLGAAYYRAGDQKAAIEALNKSMNQRKGGNAFDWFFLAIAHWQLGDKKEASQWYDRAIAWMDKNAAQNEELRRLRAEASELLGIGKAKD